MGPAPSCFPPQASLTISLPTRAARRDRSKAEDTQEKIHGNRTWTPNSSLTLTWQNPGPQAAAARRYYCGMVSWEGLSQGPSRGNNGNLRTVQSKQEFSVVRRPRLHGHLRSQIVGQEQSAPFRGMAGRDPSPNLTNADHSILIQ